MTATPTEATDAPPGDDRRTRRDHRRLPVRRRRLVGALLGAVVAAVTVIVIVPATAASAHAELISTQPADASVAATSPTQIVLTFSERIEAKLGAVRLINSDGRAVAVGPAGHLDGKVSTIAATVPHLDDGTYVVTWRAISSDSHPVFGSFTFQVGQGPAVDTRSLRTAALAGSHASGGVALGLGTVRWLVFAGAAISLGALAFLAMLWPAGAGDRNVRRLLPASLGVLAAASLAGIAFQGAYADAGALGQVVRPALWRAIVGTRFGEAALVRATLAIALAATVARRPALLARRPWRTGAAVAATATLGTIAVAGHATTGVRPAVGLVADLGHLGALSVWIGGLVVLALATRSALTTVDDVKALARRFSPIALVSVGVLVVSGSVQSWRQLGDRSGLGTTYGHLLLLKLGLVAVVLLTAWTSRRMVGAWRRGAERDVFTFGRHLVTELVVIGAVLVATSALVATQPGRETAGGPVTVEIADKDTRLTMTIDPARHGTAAFHLYLSPPGGALQQVKAVTMQLSLAGTGIDRLEVPLDPAGPNHFTTESGSVPLPGRWQVKVSALLTEFDERVFTTTVRFR